MSRLKSKISKIANYGTISKDRQMLMGMAAVGICIFHLVFFAAATLKKNEALYLGVGTLNVGVEVFLILSGIGLYFSMVKKPSFIDYYVKRIFNVYAVFLVINLPYVLYLRHVTPYMTAKDFLLRWSSLSYWINGYPNETKLGWYVVYAMVLYALYPLIFRFYKLLDKHKLDYEFTFVFCIAWAVMCFLLNKYFPEKYFFVEAGVVRIPAFIIGCYMGKLVYNREKMTPHFLSLVIIGLLLRGAYFISSRTLVENRLTQTVLAISIIGIAVFAVELFNLNIIRAVFSHLGKMSLELYLIHNMLRVVIVRMGYTRLRHYLIMLLISYLLSLIISTVRIYLMKKYAEHTKKKKST